ncbi:hypothetical protein [Halovivax sp.]|uniref:hypothetical protein n=1 Tax=Halovivax sp. TaxID=1935978 RepID=UPI0025B9D21A|nr:hypothetical protein [Halovivax sp.]
MSIASVLTGLVGTVVTIAVLVLLATLAFFVSVFVVSSGAWLAGYDPSGDFVVLSASLLVVAALLGGIPLGRSRDQGPMPEEQDTTGFQ